ncbi:MAG: hypothetical protein ACREMA_03705, partial [Longimicrobiales bacterium]
LSHGDDPYSYAFGNPPFFPTADLLIIEATFQAWFGPGVAEEQRCDNVGRRSRDLRESHPGSGNMPYLQFKVQSYSVLLGGDFFDSGADAVIVCRGVGGQTLIVLFHPPGKSLPSNYSSASLEFGLLHVSVEKYPWYVDLLRNEKPITASVNSSASENSVFSGEEPVGEGERTDALWEVITEVFSPPV